MRAFQLACILLVGGTLAEDDSIEMVQKSVAMGKGHLANFVPVPSGPGYARAIWCFWQYDHTPSPWVQLNLDTWAKHAPAFKIMYVNDTNIRDYIPDLPEEFFRLPYASAKSDFIRAALLYHHGGIYMDTDFIMMSNIDPVLKELDHSDMVAYRTAPMDGHRQCGDGFSSNFMAGRAKNKFSQTWWENVKQKLTRKCPPNGFSYEKVCCHEEGATEPETRACHIPWAQLEHLKVPEQDHDRKPARLDPTHKHDLSLLQALESEKEENLAKKWDPDTKMTCFVADESFAPHCNGEVYWQRWNNQTQSTELGDSAPKNNARDYDTRFDCKLTNEDNLECASGNWGKNQHRTIKNIPNRIAAHLFSSTRSVHVATKKEAMEGDWFVSELYRRSLGYKF